MKKNKNSILRIKLIQGFLDDAEKEGKKLGTKNVQLRDGSLPRTIISVPSEYLMYRIQNTRTRRQQLRYLRNHPDLPKDLFLDPESQRAQDAQESILLDMIDATGQDFVRDLDEHGQDDPAIITLEGYIINGNRRTAALRRIGKEYINCVVLPKNITKKEIYNLEIDLQMSKDFREEYHWVNELIDIEEGINNFDESEDEIARRLRIKPAELRAKLRMKFLVDKFLQWKGISGEYDYERLDDAEQDFFELEKETRKTKYSNNPLLSDQLEKALFNLVDSKPKEGRSYTWGRDLFKGFDEVYDLMKEKSGKPISKSINKPDNSSGMKIKTNSLVDALTYGDDSQKLVDVFGDANNSSNISMTLQEIIQDVKAKNKERKGAEAVYDAVSDALRQLQGLSINKNTSKIVGITNKLNEIIKISSDLSKQARKWQK